MAGKSKAPTFSGPVVLGIHSNVVGGDHSMRSGHAWITVKEGDKTVYFGLWPDGHPRTVDNKEKTDVRVGLEAGRKAAASRFYRLGKARTQRLNSFLQKRRGWSVTYNCSSWASHLFYQVVGVDVDADDWFSVETPRELGSSIRELENNKKSTTRGSPTSPGEEQASSSLTG